VELDELEDIRAVREALSQGKPMAPETGEPYPVL